MNIDKLSPSLYTQTIQCHFRRRKKGNIPIKNGSLVGFHWWAQKRECSVGNSLASLWDIFVLEHSTDLVSNLQITKFFYVKSFGNQQIIERNKVYALLQHLVWYVWTYFVRWFSEANESFLDAGASFTPSSSSRFAFLVLLMLRSLDILNSVPSETFNADLKGML